MGGYFKINETLRISGNRKELFEELMAIERYPLWWPSDTTTTGPSPVSLRSNFHLTTPAGAFDVRVTYLEPPLFMGWDLYGGELVGSLQWFLKPAGGLFTWVEIRGRARCTDFLHSLLIRPKKAFPRTLRRAIEGLGRIGAGNEAAPPGSRAA